MVHTKPKNQELATEQSQGILIDALGLKKTKPPMPRAGSGRNAPFIRFLISALYIIIVCLFLSHAFPLILFSSLLLYLSPPLGLLIFSFENRPAPFPGRMS